MARSVKKPERRRNEFFDAAERCFRRRGYYETSVEEIADDVGVAKGLFYYYFRSKEDLVEQMAVKIWDDTEPDLVAIVEDDELDAVAKLMLFSKVRRESKAQRLYLWDVVEKERDSLFMRRITEEGVRRMVPLLGRIVRQGVEEGFFDTPYPEEAVEFMLRGSEFITSADLSDPEVLRRQIYIVFDLWRRVLGEDQGVFEGLAKEGEGFVRAMTEQVKKGNGRSGRTDKEERK